MNHLDFLDEIRELSARDAEQERAQKQKQRESVVEAQETPSRRLSGRHDISSELSLALEEVHKTVSLEAEREESARLQHKSTQIAAQEEAMRQGAALKQQEIAARIEEENRRREAMVREQRLRVDAREPIRATHA